MTTPTVCCLVAPHARHIADIVTTFTGQEMFTFRLLVYGVHLLVTIDSRSLSRPGELIAPPPQC